VRLSQVVFIALLLLVGGGFAIRYASLPPLVASHFGANGQPNAWMTRSDFAWSTVLPLVVVVVVALLAPLLVAKLPVSMVNLPNKNYWLAPERKDASFRRLRARMEWFGVALLAFLAFVYDLVFKANTGGGGLANGPFLAALVGFLVFTIVWTVSLHRAFPRPPA
jgi:uncharacterized membrane protein